MRPSTNNRARGFTLAEVLAAMALMAIVIPVAVHALRLATLAGELSQRKAIAARIGERLLNETILNAQNGAPSQNGTEQVGPYDFQYVIKDEPWSALANSTVATSPTGVNQSVVNSSTIHQLTADISFAAQGKQFTVHLSTLHNTTAQ
jgi:prepilin-type N-terminal cleavage/methylation domain-containing protein